MFGPKRMPVTNFHTLESFPSSLVPFPNEMAVKMIITHKHTESNIEDGKNIDRSMGLLSIKNKQEPTEYYNILPRKFDELKEEDVEALAEWQNKYFIDEDDNVNKIDMVHLYDRHKYYSCFYVAWIRNENTCNQPNDRN